MSAISALERVEIDRISLLLRAFEIAAQSTSTPVVYASCPITTGPRMYRVLRRHKIASVEALARVDGKLFFGSVMRPNIEEAKQFRAAVHAQLGGVVISPAPLKVHDWGQAHYMALWEATLQRYVKVIRFKRGWQYSNGCAEEFLIGLTHGLALQRERGATLTGPQGAALIRQAIRQLEGWRFDPAKLIDLYRRIELRVRDRG